MRRGSEVAVVVAVAVAGHYALAVGLPRGSGSVVAMLFVRAVLLLCSCGAVVAVLLLCRCGVAV